MVQFLSTNHVEIKDSPDANEPFKEALDRCRQAVTSGEQAVSWNTLIDHIRRSDSSTAAWVAKQVLIEWPHNSVYSSFFDQFMDVCGRIVTTSTCCALLQQLGRKEEIHSKIPPSGVLEACWTILRRQLLSKECDRRLSAFEETKNDLERFVKLVLSVPSFVANACHVCKVRLPLLATSTKFLPRLMESSWSDSSSNEYRIFLLKAFLASRTNAAPIAIGLASYHPLPASILSTTSWNDRQLTNLILALLQHCAVNEDAEAAPRVMATCESIMKSVSVDQQKMVLHHIAFKPVGDIRLCPLLISLLERCDTLVSNLCDVAEEWSKWSFGQQIPTNHQHFVSEIILEGLKRIPINIDDPSSMVHEDTLTLHLLQGVTHRLESFVPEIRRDGMRIAQQVARRRNQVIQFDELWETDPPSTSEGDDKNVNSNGENGAAMQAASQKVTFRPTEEKANKRHRRLRDPDAEYDSDGEIDEVENNEDDTSTVYEDELVPYSLEDDEEDLAGTPKPLYLLQALELLRTGERDEHAYSHHEAAMRALPALIRKRQDDLPDVAISLLMELLRIEDKFGIDGFLHLRQQSLVALAVIQPVAVGKQLIEMVFKDNCLSDRLACFGALQEAAYELSGTKDLDQIAISNSGRTSDSNDDKLTSGSKSNDESTSQLARLQSKTRRKRGPRATPVVVKNLFTPVAPVWFYSLMGCFLEKRDNDVLWGGSTGSQLLASLLRTLAVIVEFAGISAAPVLAKDLMEMAWAFLDADVAEVRMAVLTSIATLFVVLPEDAAHSILLQQGDRWLDSISTMSRVDPDSGCQQLAITISQSIVHVLGDMRSPLLQSKAEFGIQ